MECKGVCEALPAYLDHELTSERLLAVENHLQSCSRCRTMYEQQEKLHGAVKRDAVQFTAPDHLENRIKGVLRTHTASAVRAAGRVPGSWPVFGAALVAAAAIAWTIGLYSSLPSTTETEGLADEIIDSHVRGLITQHLTDVSSSDRHTVKPWFNGKLDFSPPVKDLGEDFPLLGGRLDYFNHRPVATVVYRRRKHIITVFAARTEAHPAELPPRLTRRGFHLFHWKQGEIDFAAVSDLNPSELAQFQERYSS